MTWNLMRFGWFRKALGSVPAGINKPLEKQARVLIIPIRNIVKVMGLARTFNSDDI
jgi:hypothetical protein